METNREQLFIPRLYYLEVEDHNNGFLLSDCLIAGSQRPWVLPTTHVRDNKPEVIVLLTVTLSKIQSVYYQDCY